MEIQGRPANEEPFLGLRPVFWIWIALVLALLVLGWWADRLQLVDWPAIAAAALTIRALAVEHPVIFTGAFCGAFLLAAILLWPAQLWLIVLAGFAFGLPGAFVLVWACAIVGALAVYLLATHALGETYARRNSKVLRTLRAEFAHDQLLYMLVLRWLPVSPYAVANVIPPLLGASLGKFMAVAVVGVLPDVVTYSLVGAALATALDPSKPLDIAVATATFMPVLVAVAAVPVCWLVAKRLLQRRGAGSETALKAAIIDNLPDDQPSGGKE